MVIKILSLAICVFGLLAALALHFTGHRPEAGRVAGVTCLAAATLTLVAIYKAKRR
jgi:hypothetical protein